MKKLSALMLGMVLSGLLTTTSQANAVLPTADTTGVEGAQTSQPIVFQRLPTQTSNPPKMMNKPVTKSLPSSSQEIAVNVKASLVSKNGAGQEVLTPITRSTQLGRNSIIEYTAELTNNNAERVGNMVVTMGIPKGTTLVGNTVPNFPKATTDGNIYSTVPLQTIVNGQMQAVPLYQYKALRWQLSNIAANDSTKVAYRVKLN